LSPPPLPPPVDVEGNRPIAPDNKYPRIIEEIIAKYAVNANLFRLWPPILEKNPALFFFWAFITESLLSEGGGLAFDQ